MVKTKARIKAWWHALTHCHRSCEWLDANNKTLVIGCYDCGKVFYDKNAKPSERFRTMDGEAVVTFMALNITEANRFCIKHGLSFYHLEKIS